jgi:hypothetical protein
MSTMKCSGRFEALVRRTKHHAEHNAESMVQSPQRVIQNAGMFGNGCGYQWM